MGIEAHSPNNQPRGGRADDRRVLSGIVPPVVIPPALGDLVIAAEARQGAWNIPIRRLFANNPPEKALACKRRLVVQLY